MLVVSAAALTTLENFMRIGKTSERRLDQQDRVRESTRGIVRDLRNVAASPDRPIIIEHGSDYDVVFKTVLDEGDSGGEHDASPTGPLLPRLA